jgi:hypothetical protein
MLEKLNGSVRIDVLSPAERALLRALEQAGAAGEEPIPASAAWANLVVAARNPGTRRMLLQALAYRGLVEVSGRMVDPDRSRVRIVGEKDAWRLLEEAERRIAEIEGDPEAREWGYIVSAKARGFRAGSLREFAGKMRHLLEVAREALRAGDRLMALRLLRTVLDTVDYVREEVLERHVRAAASEARRLMRELRGKAERIGELVEALEDAIERLAGRRVRVEVSVEQALREAEKVYREVAGLEMSEAELEAGVQKLWEEARRQSPRDPGRRLPFYVQGMGPVYHFNYKFWLLVDRLSRLGLVEADHSGVRVGGSLGRVEERLAGLVEEARRLLEEAADVRRRAERLAGKLEKLGVRGARPEAIILPGVELPEKVDVGEAEQLISLLRSRMEEARKPLVELEGRVDRLSTLLEEVEKLEREARAWHGSIAEKAARTREAGHPLARRLESIASDLKLAIDQAQAVRGKAFELLSSTSNTLEALENAVRIMESAKLLLSDSLDRAKRLYAEAEEEAARIAETLRLEAEALAQALSKAGETPPQPPKTADPFRALAELASYISRLHQLVLKAEVMGGEELEAYMAIVHARSRRGELLMREAVRIVAEKLGVDEAKAKRIIISLIERDIIEPKL